MRTANSVAFERVANLEEHKYLHVDTLSGECAGLLIYRVYQKKVNNYKMAYKSNMQLNFRRIFCEYGYFKVF